MERTKAKLLAATAMSLSVLASASIHADPAEAASRAGALPTASGEGSQKISITRSGSQPSRKGPAENFTGSVRIDPLYQPKDPSRTSGAYVTFGPGACSAWHTHSLWQFLIVTAGSGREQRWGGPIEEIRQGDGVWIPPGQKHWHGASPNTAMTHIAIHEALDGNVVEWMEKVSDERYGKLP